MIIQLKLVLYGDVLHSLYELARYGLVSGLRRLITTSEKSQRDQKKHCIWQISSTILF